MKPTCTKPQEREHPTHERAARISEKGRLVPKNRISVDPKQAGISYVKHLCDAVVQAESSFEAWRGPISNGVGRAFKRHLHITGQIKYDPALSTE
ncbi:hypothetical protein AVEN_253605-1 [Araneus ventricosus]|uniref:Uncharacterized protein n=1 Tax=Araneus ventricosus TaxID=182803 RepID=A0A4Y2C9V2_ARAVE|nr:hypothetical protein AVEN_253605-1 [Araneus ventricosus]